MYLQTQYLDNLNTDGWNPNTSTDRAPRPLQGALSCAVLSRGEPFPSLLPQLRPTGGGAAVETILPMTLGARWGFCIGQRNGGTGIVMHVHLGSVILLLRLILLEQIQIQILMLADTLYYCIIPDSPIAADTISARWRTRRV